MADEVVSSLDVLEFWWDAGPAKWFAKDTKFDGRCKDQFLSALDAARAGLLDDWTGSAEGALALILLLDQMPRNIFRGTAEAFASDQKALQIAELALERGFDKAYPKEVRVFFYLPFEHSELMAHQEKSVDLARRLGNQEFYHYALLHMDVIRRFGRFPHRNAVLGRETSDAEMAYLADGGFSA